MSDHNLIKNSERAKLIKNWINKIDQTAEALEAWRDYLIQAEAVLPSEVNAIKLISLGWDAQSSMAELTHAIAGPKLPKLEQAATGQNEIQLIAKSLLSEHDFADLEPILDRLAISDPAEAHRLIEFIAQSG